MKFQLKFQTALLSFLLVLSILVFAGCKDTNTKETITDTKNSALNKEPSDRKEISESVQIQVDSLSGEEGERKREKVMEEAIAAIRETETAIEALDDTKKYEALAALERATGKLELLLARNPSLALAPIDVSVTTHDLLTTLEDIKSARNKAEDYLEDGEIQKARMLLDKMVCEIVVRVTNIPLASYPEAIKAVSPLIEDGKNLEAKSALQAALNTLVVTSHIIPLPVIRAEEMLKDAEALAEKEDRSKEGNDSLATLLNNADYQIKMAQALGYGDKKDYKR
ncbi:MAG: YfdX family protein, partial [Fibrobacteria bacterium]|nr:YfdX family protein [Fibrobacteria bacterium]